MMIILLFCLTNAVTRINELYYNGNSLVTVFSYSSPSCTPQSRVGDKEVVCIGGSTYLPTPPDNNNFNFKSTSRTSLNCVDKGDTQTYLYRHNTCITVNGVHYKSTCLDNLRTWRFETFSDASCSSVLTTETYNPGTCYGNTTLNLSILHDCGAYATQTPTTTTASLIYVTRPPWYNTTSSDAARLAIIMGLLFVFISCQSIL